MAVMIVMNGIGSFQHVKLTDRNAVVIFVPVLMTVVVSLVPGAVVQGMPTR